MCVCVCVCTLYYNSSCVYNGVCTRHYEDTFISHLLLLLTLPNFIDAGFTTNFKLGEDERFY